MIKQFLKPSWIKIVIGLSFWVLTIIITFVLFFIGMYLWPAASAPRIYPLLIDFFLYISGLLIIIPTSSLQFLDKIPIISRFIFFLIYLYIIGCLIVWIYDKIKKR